MLPISMEDVFAYKIWEIKSCIIIIPHFMYKTISGNVLYFFSSQFTWLEHPNIPLGRLGICNYFYSTNKKTGGSDFKWHVQGDTGAGPSQKSVSSSQQSACPRTPFYFLCLHSWLTEKRKLPFNDLDIGPFIPY